jgi:hypothetical protein
LVKSWHGSGQDHAIDQGCRAPTESR